jgi:hypothetical protein
MQRPPSAASAEPPAGREVSILPTAALMVFLEGRPGSQMARLCRHAFRSGARVRWIFLDTDRTVVRAQAKRSRQAAGGKPEIESYQEKSQASAGSEVHPAYGQSAHDLPVGKQQQHGQQDEGQRQSQGYLT